MISVEDLCFTYPRSNDKTLKNLNFNIQPQEIFGFLGPSGAGKTTTQNILIGLLKSYSGSVRVFDREIHTWDKSYYEKIGVCFELPNHYLKLSAKENLDYFASLYSGDTLASDTVLTWLGLEEHQNKPVSDFSKGMKIRLNLARSLLHRPKLLFLDEPTAGLDPSNARRVKELIQKLREEGVTVLLTTHDMSVADQLCDRVAFINNGGVDTIDSPEHLKKQFGQRTLIVEYLDQQNRSQTVEFPLDGLSENQNFLSVLSGAKRIETLHSQETTLEQVFIDVTGAALNA